MTAACASGGIKPACWTRCWRRSRKFRWTKTSRASAKACAAFRASSGSSSRRDSWANCATTSAKAWAGWQFLREFGFGGCLADDMGVGKTAQVLAMLESRRAEGKGPSLVVVPKSLMFNWREEAARFTPQLRVLEHTGTAPRREAIADHDLVLTTYGTLLRDAPQLAEIEFDYVVLDEAQAIKNASTASAKAVRLLRGAHRLALSGTPVENHLGELWSCSNSSIPACWARRAC